jgi:hypothetical protein
MQAVGAPAMVIKLPEQLHVWERGINERERALGRARMECDAEHDRVKCDTPSVTVAATVFKH